MPSFGHPARHRAGEAVTDSRHRRDPFAAIVCRAEKLAQRRDLNRQVAFLDGSPGPCRIHQRGLGDGFAGCSQQCGKQTNAFLVDRHWPSVAQQYAARGIKHEGAEGKPLHQTKRSGAHAAA